MLSFLRTGGRIRREAADWVAKFGGNPSNEVRDQFQKWHDRDPRHAEAYARFAEIWGLAGTTQRPLVRQPSSRPKQPVPHYRLAAAVALLFIGGSTFLPLLMAGKSQAAILATQLHESKTISLVDGSRILLGPASRAMARLDGGERRVTLEQGSARFEIARDSRPFVVEVMGHEVMSRGSLFDVVAHQNSASVAPIDHPLEVRGVSRWALFGEKVRRADPGQKLVIDEQGLRTEPPTVGARAAMIQFENVSLRDAVHRFNRASGSNLEVAGDASSLRLTGAFRIGDAEGFATSVASALSLDIESRSDGTLLLSSAR